MCGHDTGLKTRARVSKQYKPRNGVVGCENECHCEKKEMLGGWMMWVSGSEEWTNGGRQD